MKFIKINWGLVVIYLFIGFGVSALAVLVGGRNLPYEFSELLAGTVMAGIVLSGLCFLVFGALFYSIGKSRFNKLLEANDITCVSRFDSYNAVIAIDVDHGKIVVLGRYNPFKVQVLDASHITSAKVSDGKGITGGTSLVSFIFYLDNTKFKIPTFSSNRCFNMNSDQVIRGIEKAEKQVKYLMAAKDGVKGQVSGSKVSGKMEQRIG